MGKIGLIAFASTLLLTAPSYATEKVWLSCVGTVWTDRGASERTEGSLIIDFDKGLVMWGTDNFPIDENGGTGIHF